MVSQEKFNGQKSLVAHSSRWCMGTISNQNLKRFDETAFSYGESWEYATFCTFNILYTIWIYN